MSNEVPASTAAAVSSNNFYDPFLLQPQSLCIYPYSSQPASPAAIYDAPSQFAFPLQNCPPQSFTFSPTGIQGSALHWQSIESVHEGVLTPTNVNGTFTEFGAVASATPEFIHPRNSNVPQWLMSPPVGDQDPSIISYAPLNTPTHSTAVSEPLMTPADFVPRSPIPTPPDQLLLQMLDVGKNSVRSQDCISHPDSGISSPREQTKLNSFKTESNHFTEKIFEISKQCSSFSDFERKIKDILPRDICVSMLSCLLHFALSQKPPFSHECLLQKLTASENGDVSTVLFNKDSPKKIFPIGVFWDIENCQVPSGKSSLAIVQKIRRQFFNDHVEAEFMAVCDINKESRHVIQDLNNAQVNVIHVNAVAKNAADDKLRQSLRRYAQTHIAPATVILITGDCNFTSEVSDLRHRHKYFVVLIHPVNASKALVEAANTAVSYEEFVADLPVVYASKDSVSEQHLLVSNLPSYVDVGMIRGKLKQISENCGGKVINVMPPTAIIKFSTEELARRALKRLNGEMVHGNKIFVQRKTSDLSALSKHFTPRRRAFQPQMARHLMQQSNRIHEASCPDKFDSPSNHSPVSNDSGVQLTISNIDAQLGVNTIQEKIWNLITQHTQLWKLQIRPHNRFTVMCDVTVPDVDSASVILQSLHRRKLGNKRILVTISQKLEDERTLLKKELLPLLKEYARNGIQFNELISLYAQSYHKSLKLGQIRQLHDFVVLREINDKVFIFLAKNDENPLFSVCKQHYRPDRVQMRPPIKINIGLREFSAKLHALLYSHSGSIVLNSFEQCYLAQFGSFPYPQEGSGVFLEHQISYVPGVQIIDGDVKTVVWSQPHSDNGSDTASETSTSSRSKSSNLVNFARELVDLLKTFPYCCLPCADVSMAYQRHYGHALRTNGFSSVSDMLLSIPHVVQIIGPPHNHLLTLTHRAQVKRFTQEMIKLLKASPDRAILVAQLPDMYYRTFDRVWNLRDYGVSVLSDILDDIPDGNIGVSGEGDNIVLSLPTRERTIDEIQRTNLFSHELFEILRLRPRCRMSFTEFVPAYHRQFGRQCKLSNYGFSKLLDLFESLPQVVKVIDEVPEKYLQLTDEEQLKVLTSQLVGLLRQQGGDSNDSVGIPLSRLQSMYSHKYSFPLVPRHYNCDDIESVVKLLSHAVKLARGPNNELVVKQSERKPIRLLCAQLLVLMLDLNNEQVNLNHLQQVYIDRYNECIAPCEYGFLSLTDVVKKALSGIAKFETNSGNTLLSLKPIYQRGKRIRAILLAHNGTMTLGEFNQAYKAKHGEALDAEHHGFRSCEGMLRALSMVLVVKGFGIKKTIVLRNHMQHGPLTSSVDHANDGLSDTQSYTDVKPPPLQEILSVMKSTRAIDSSDVTKPASDVVSNQHTKQASVMSTESKALSKPKSHYLTEKENLLISSTHHPASPKYKEYQPCHSWIYTNSSKYEAAKPKPHFSFDMNSIQGPFIYPFITNYKNTSAPLNCSTAEDRGVSLSGIGPNISHPPRRRISVSVITLPNGTTSISSNSSPDSFLSTDEDAKVSPDTSHLLQNDERPNPSQLRLAASFTATPL